MQKLNVTVHEHECVRKINPGFQNAQRPSWYLATQEAIIPREPFFAAICAQLLERSIAPGETLGIFEPGVGTGAFFHFILTKTRLAEYWQLHLTGADVSAEMIQRCYDQLSSLPFLPGWRPVLVELHSRLDLLPLSGAGIQRISGRSPFDVIVASQFEHSYPNDAHSALAATLRAEQIVAGTKHDFRQFAFNHLREGGFYYSIDDYITGDSALDDSQTRDWDAAVLDRLSDPEFVRGLEQRFPKVSAGLQRRYNASHKREAQLEKIAHARQRRRLLSKEETANLQSTLHDLSSLFGPDNVTALRHPSPAHRQFYLVRARRIVRGENHPGALRPGP